MTNERIYIDYSNRKQIRWWNRYASRLVKVKKYTEVYNGTTNEKIGAICELEKGLFNDYVMDEIKCFA